jgi:hypothetical protein
MSRDQIEEQIAAQLPDSDAGAGDETDDDPDGFDPDEDSEADDERGADEVFEKEHSEWEALEGPPLPRQAEADIVLQPGETEHTWIAVLVRPAAAPGLPVSPLMRRALEGRDRIILAVAQAIVDRQGRYVTTGDSSELEAVTQDTIATLAGVTKGRVSRAIARNTLRLPDGQVVPLEALVVDSDFVRARLVRDLFVELDRVKRVEGVAVKVDRVAAWKEVYRTAQQRMASQHGAAAQRERGNAESNFRRAARRFGLPVSARERRKAYLEGKDWWAISF